MLNPRTHLINQHGRVHIERDQRVGCRKLCHLKIGDREEVWIFSKSLTATAYTPISAINSRSNFNNYLSKSWELSINWTVQIQLHWTIKCFFTLFNSTAQQIDSAVHMRKDAIQSVLPGNLPWKCLVSPYFSFYFCSCFLHFHVSTFTFVLPALIKWTFLFRF